MSSRLDFCCCCGSWVAADDGEIRLGSNGEPEIICSECLATKPQPDEAALALGPRSAIFWLAGSSGNASVEVKNRNREWSHERRTPNHH